MAYVTWAVDHCHAAGLARRLVVKWRHSKGLVVQALLCLVVQVVECHWVYNLTYTELLNLIICVEVEANTRESILDGVLVVKSLSCHL